MGAMLLVGAAPLTRLAPGRRSAAGVVTVSGGHAVRSASISWEGVAVTTANRGGSFAFTTTIVPVDCIGTVNDGTSSVDVRIDGCGDVTSGLPGTGQITSYASGDDGDIHAGGPLSYTDNGDGTVTDNPYVSPEKEDRRQCCHALHLVGRVGLCRGVECDELRGPQRWRLPNIKELLSIVDYGRSNPAIDPIFGPTAGGSNRAAYWSSTSWATFYPEVNAWGVEFLEIYGTPSATIPFGKTSSLRVRAVRGGL